MAERACVVGVSQLIRFGVTGGLCPRASQLEEAHGTPFPILEGRGRHKTQRGRRIEIAVVVNGQCRRPVVASSDVQKEPVAVAQVEEAVERVDFFLPPRLAEGAFSGVRVVVYRVKIGVGPCARGAVQTVAVAVVLLAAYREAHVELRVEDFVLVRRDEEVHITGQRTRLAL